MSYDWLVVGLGNPTDKYKNTRHNIGFMVVDKFTSKFPSKLKFEKKFEAILGPSNCLDNEQILFAKPQTFMNDSGRSIKKIADYYKISLEKIIIIYDDISLDFGRFRYRITGSAGGHNGIKSIISSFDESKDFPRLKIGIGPKPTEGELIDFVLGDFSEIEQSDLSTLLNKAEEHLFTIMKQSAELAMTEINKNG